jgi:hypothetical protein
MRLAAAWVVVGVVGLLAPSRAEAICVRPTWSAQLDGEAPRSGVAFVHVEGGALAARPKVAWTGEPGTAAISPLSPHVVRIDYSAPRATALAVEVSGEKTELRFGSMARAIVPIAREIGHHESAWTCSSSDLIAVVVVGRAAGFRVRWTSGGRTTTWVEAALALGDGTSLVEIGKRNCGDAEIDPREIHAGGSLELAAIDFDGTERRVEGIPSRLQFVPPSDLPRQLATLAILAALYGAYRVWLARVG